jgi:ferrous iron transport protein B
MSKILLVGNPNAGKTSLFNQLTGLNQRTGNFHGVTVSYSSGKIQYENSELEIIDLPGSFSLNSNTDDKKVLLHYLLNRDKTDKILFVLDATQLERGLLFFLQVQELTNQMVLVLTMEDILAKSNISIDIDKLSKELGVEVFLVNSKTGKGITELKESIYHDSKFLKPNKIWNWDRKRENFIQKIKSKISYTNTQFFDYILLNSLKKASGEIIISELPCFDKINPSIYEYIQKEILKSKNNFTYEEEVIFKSIGIKKILSKCIKGEILINQNTFTEKLDKFLLHPRFGILIFLVLMLALFQTLFSWSEVPMNFLESVFKFISEQTTKLIPEGPFQGLVSKGIINGVGSVMVFIPQIAILFFFIGILEETGYLARILYLMDKFMGKFGLSGKSFFPIISSAACAVPAILSARTIDNKSEKIITILVSPLITCSARYPVYILLISSIFPETHFFGFLSLQALVLFGLFFLGMFTAFVFAVLFKKLFFKKDSSFFLVELPVYRTPSLKNLFLYTYQNVKSFVLNSGKVILYVSILLWFLASFPFHKENDISQSYLAQMGKAIEPAIEPLGFNWKIGVGLISSFAAREVMVSTMAILYNVNEEDNDTLKEKIKTDRTESGKLTFSFLTSISLLIFFAYASQCMSTLSVVRQETNSYFWPSFLFFYMFCLAYLSSLFVYQFGKFLGYN